jgi:hypothetical protein
MKKIKDLAVKTGTYESGGQTKGRYLNVGSVMEDDNGGKFLMIDRTFNPAGVPNPDNRSNVIISMFDVRSHEASESAAPSPTGEDDIPL